MKIYSSDGSFIHNISDTDFGWNFEQIAHMSNLHLVSAKVHNLVKIDEIIPSKTKLLSLINPCTIESKVLLSVVHYALYKNFNTDMIKVECLKEATHVHFPKDVDGLIQDTIKNYFEMRKRNHLPLMIDLILSENKCDIDEFTSDRDLEESFKACTSCNDVKIRNSYEEESLESVNSARDVICKQVEKIYAEIEQIQNQICEIRKDFRKDTKHVNSLIANGRTLEKNLRETKFLDDLINLLKGNLEKVVLKESPFRIFLNPTQLNELNLII